jgi:hypothetical protein
MVFTMYYQHFLSNGHLIHFIPGTVSPNTVMASTRDALGSTLQMLIMGDVDFINPKTGTVVKHGNGQFPIDS